MLLSRRKTVTPSNKPAYTVDRRYVLVTTTRGYLTILDADAWEGITGPLRATADGRVMYKDKDLGRYIMDTPKGLHIDHINRVRWDNRRENLRNVSAADNSRNRVPHSHYATHTT